MRFPIFAFATLLVLSGCQSEEFFTRGMVESNVGGTFQGKDTVLRDIPLPNDFAMRDGSFCFGTDSFRYGEFLLRGDTAVRDVVAFYRKHMPTQGTWQEVEVQDMDSSARLRYANAKELCAILCREVEDKTELKIIVEQKKKP